MGEKKLTVIWYWICVCISFLITTAGYMMAGKEWYDAGYYSALTFAMNYVDVEHRNILIYVGRVICPLITVAGLLTLLQEICRTVSCTVASFRKDATALYFEEEGKKEIAYQFQHPVLMGKRINPRVKDHVLLLENDIDNLLFYQQISKKIKKGSRVFVKMEEMESCLLKDSNICYFNKNEIIARLYWENRNLQKYMRDGKLTVKIAILGFNTLGQNILDYGLMKNIYSLTQNIQYHIWGNSNLYANQLGNFDMMNEDSVIYHSTDWQEDIGQFNLFDRIIVVQEPAIEMLQALLYKSGSNTEIDFYNPTGIALEAVYKSDKLTSFGMQDTILTEENIKTDKLYRAAKKLNFNYAVAYDVTGSYTWDMPELEKNIELKWKELDGFLKGSNIAAADYFQIRDYVMEAHGINPSRISEKQLEMLKKMEHIRWCRYYFVNHWQYAPKRNNEMRQHHLLVPYEKLSQEEKDKDEKVIWLLLGVNQ